MAGIIDFTALTLNPEEALSLSEIVFEKVFENPTLTEVHEVVTGVIYDKFIPIFGKLGMVGKASTHGTGCGVNDSDAEIPTSQKKWSPKEISTRLTHCKKDVPELFKAFKRRVKALDSYDLEGSEEMQFLASELIESMLEAIWRIAWFADTTADNVSGGGVITDGIDVEFFDMIDGLFKQIFTAVAGGSIKKISIPENAGTTYVAQDNLPIDRAYEVFKAVYNGADSRLRGVKGAKILATDSMIANWIDFMEDKSLTFQTERAEKGTSKLTFRGIPIVKMDIWDRMIRAYEDDGSAWHLPHRVVFTIPQNIPIGTMDEESMQEVDSFYEKKDKTNILDAVWTEDAKLIQEYLTIVAY